MRIRLRIVYKRKEIALRVGVRLGWVLRVKIRLRRARGRKGKPL